MMVIKRRCHAVKVRGRRKEDKHVEYLMGAAPDVKSSRIDSLWKASRIEDCTKYVQEALQDDPAEAHSILESLVAKFEEAVANWDDAREAEADEHDGAVWSPGGGSEFIDPRDGHASHAEDAYQIQISRHQDRMAKEAIVQRRHVASHNQSHDARIVQFIAPSRNLLAMVRQSMIRGAHPETHHGAAKEARKDQHI